MPDLLLLDINLPGKNGLEIAKELKQNFPGLKIIFLTMYNEQKFIQEAMQLNVNGYLLKDSTSTEFIDGIKTVLRNPSSFFKDPKLPKVDYNLHHEDYFVKRFLLSSREIQIIRLIREGKRSSEIAEELFLSHETVKSHRKNIHYKLGIRKAAELIQFASKHGI